MSDNYNEEYSELISSAERFLNHMENKKKQKTETQEKAERMTNKTPVPKARQTAEEGQSEYFKNLVILCVGAVVIALLIL